MTGVKSHKVTVGEPAVDHLTLKKRTLQCSHRLSDEKTSSKNLYRLVAQVVRAHPDKGEVGGSSPPAYQIRPVLLLRQSRIVCFASPRRARKRIKGKRFHQSMGL